MMCPAPQLLNAQQAAAYTGIPYTTLRDMALRGDVPVVVETADLPPMVGPLIMRELSVLGLPNQSVFCIVVSLWITRARA